MVFLLLGAACFGVYTLAESIFREYAALLPIAAHGSSATINLIPSLFGAIFS